MDNLRFEVKARITTDDHWRVIGLANSQEQLSSLLERVKLTYRYVTWNSYRA